MKLDVASSSSIVFNDSNFLLQLLSCQLLLEAYRADPVINSNAETQAFLNDLKVILETKQIPEKYKDSSLQEFYMIWLNLINPSHHEQNKQALCAGLYEKYTDEDVPFVSILFYLPKVVQLDFIRYSNTTAIHSFYQERKNHKKHYPDVHDYFADLVKIMTHSHCYSKQDKQHFLHHVLNFLQDLKGLYATQAVIISEDPIEEALSCWMLTESLHQDGNTFNVNALLSEDYKPIFEGLALKLHGLQQSINTSDSANSLRFSFSSYTNKLLVKEYVKRLEPDNYDCLLPIIRRIHDKDELECLYQILLDCKIQPNALLVNYTILILQSTYHHSDYPDLFIENMIGFLKSKHTPSEFSACVDLLVRSVTPMLYGHQQWPFGKIKEELLKYWSEQDPQQLIDALKISLHLKGSRFETPIMSFIQKVSPQYFNDRVIDGLLAQLDTLEFITFFSVCADDILHKIVEKLFKICDPVKAIEQINGYHRVYSESVFPIRFKEGFIKHLKEVNEPLFKQAQLEQYFGLKDQSDFECDLDNLKEILNNKQLNSGQRRLEIRKLNILQQALGGDQDTCSVVMTMFKAIPPEQWPYLFICFDTEIIHWSFPYDEKYLAMLKRIKQELPEKRENTWLNHLETWSDILLSTLIAITNMRLDFSEEGYVATSALEHVQEALVKSATYIPEFPTNIFKKLFLTDVLKSMSIFSKITKDSSIVNDELIASWLPENTEQRLTWLSSVFTPVVLTGSNKDKIEKFLTKPYVRDSDEQKQLILRIVFAQQIHFLNFLELFSWNSRKIIIQNLYQIDSAGVEHLLKDIVTCIFEKIPKDSPNYFGSINLLLETLNYTEINVFNFINNSAHKEKLINVLSSLDFWNSRSLSGIKRLFRMNAQLAPEYFYSKVTQYFVSQSQGYLSLCDFTAIFGAAQNIAISPFASYTDYLNSHPDEKDKYAQLLLSNLDEFKNESNFKDIKLASLLIPDLDQYLLNHLASGISSSEVLAKRDDYSQKKITACLENLVQIYGVQVIVDKCRALGLEKQACYLDNKFKFYPQLLRQVSVLCKWHKAMLDPNYEQLDKDNSINWQTIHKINEKTLDVLSKFAIRDELPDHMIIDYVSDILKQICQKANVSVNDFSTALPRASRSLHIEVHATGALLINGIFARDKKGNHLSKAAMKFVNTYLSAKDDLVLFSKAKQEFPALDEKSQILLHDEFSKLETRYANEFDTGLPHFNL